VLIDRTKAGKIVPASNYARMDQRSRRIERRFELPLIVAAVLTIPVTILQLSPPAEPLRTIGDILNWIIWAAFFAETVTMLAVVPSKRDWLRHHPIEVAIVLFTFPLLTAAVQSVRVLRILRLFRLLRLTPSSEHSLLPKACAMPHS
jgi:hypothetical protein